MARFGSNAQSTAQGEHIGVVRLPFPLFHFLVGIYERRVFLRHDVDMWCKRMQEPIYQARREEGADLDDLPASVGDRECQSLGGIETDVVARKRPTERPKTDEKRQDGYDGYAEHYGRVWGRTAP